MSTLLQAAPLHPGSGTFVAVVGSSGVGKDSLMAYARARLPADQFVFVRRVITRDADGGSEDHDTLDRACFEAAARAGQFALSWEAHGLCYGLPISLEADLASGRTVVANVSRAIIPTLTERYPHALVVEVVAERQVIAERLAARGRETQDAIRSRLDRTVTTALPPGVVRINNSTSLDTAGDRLVQLLQAC